MSQDLSALLSEDKGSHQGSGEGELQCSDCVLGCGVVVKHETAVIHKDVIDHASLRFIHNSLEWLKVKVL